MSKKFPAEKIKNESDLKDWLTSVIYPREYASGGAVKSRAKEKINARIIYARQTGRLASEPIDPGNLHTFFEWAWTKKGWEALHQYDDTPRSATVDVRMDTAMQVALGTVKIRGIPIDPDNLRVTLIAEMEEKERLMDARAADQAEIAALKSELEQRHRRSERARHYGKMGKGVKKNS